MNETSKSFALAWKRINEINLQLKNVSVANIDSFLAKIDGEKAYSEQFTRLKGIQEEFNKGEELDLDKVIPLIDEMNEIYKSCSKILEASELSNNNSDLIREFNELISYVKDRISYVKNSMKEKGINTNN